MWIKICGVTNEEDALLAVALGADALGFVFAPGSPRQVRSREVREIVHRLPPGTTTVGVFRDERHREEPVLLGGDPADLDEHTTKVPEAVLDARH